MVLSELPRYRWVVLVAACFSQMLRAGFIAGTLSLFSIYYLQRYADRGLASNIGSAQLSVANLAAFPAVLLNKKIGERWTQIIGGLLTAGGMATTAFTVEAWHGLLSNSIATGLGAAFLMTATYSTLSKYFPGNQLAPYAAITVCQNVGVMVTPQVIERCMEQIGFKYTFIICSAIMTTNIVCGLAFLPKQKVEELTVTRKSSVNTNAITLKLIGKKQGIYRIPDTPTYQSNEEISGSYHHYDSLTTGMPRVGSSATLKQFGIDGDTVTKQEQMNRVALSNVLSDYHSRASSPEVKLHLEDSYADSDSINTNASSDSDRSTTISSASSSSRKGGSKSKNKDSEANNGPTMYQVVSQSHGESIANLLDDSSIAKQTLRKVLKSKAALNFLATSFVTTGGYVAFNVTVGDYCLTSLNYSSSDFVLGLTILGISQLITGVLYLIATRFFHFSVSFVYVVAIVCSSGVTFSLLFKPTIDVFYIIMGVSGFFKSLYVAASFGTGMEVTSPSVAVVMFMLVTMVEGIGGIVFPYISTYLQLQVSLSAGMIAAGIAQLAGGVSLLPLSIFFLITPKDYNKSREIREGIQQIGYQPTRTF